MNDTNEELVPLSLIALELQDVTADQLAKQLADSVIIADDLGRRCVAASVARSLIETEAKRRHAAAESARRREVARKERFRKLAAKRPVPRGVPHEVPEGLTLAEVMTSADGPPRYDDGIYVPAPSSVDYAFGVGVDEGGTFGPTPMQLLEQAERRERNRARRKGVRS